MKLIFTGPRDKVETALGMLKAAFARDTEVSFTVTDDDEEDDDALRSFNEEEE